MTKREWNEQRTELEIKLARAVMSYDDAMGKLHDARFQSQAYQDAMDDAQGWRQSWMEAVEALKEHMSVEIEEECKWPSCKCEREC